MRLDSNSADQGGYEEEALSQFQSSLNNNTLNHQATQPVKGRKRTNAFIKTSPTQDNIDPTEPSSSSDNMVGSRAKSRSYAIFQNEQQVFDLKSVAQQTQPDSSTTENLTVTHSLKRQRASRKNTPMTSSSILNAASNLLKNHNGEQPSTPPSTPGSSELKLSLDNLADFHNLPVSPSSSSAERKRSIINLDVCYLNLSLPECDAYLERLNNEEEDETSAESLTSPTVVEEKHDDSCPSTPSNEESKEEFAIKEDTNNAIDITIEHVPPTLDSLIEEEENVQILSEETTLNFGNKEDNKEIVRTNTRENLEDCTDTRENILGEPFEDTDNIHVETLEVTEAPIVIEETIEIKDVPELIVIENQDNIIISNLAEEHLEEGEQVSALSEISKKESEETTEDSITEHSLNDIISKERSIENQDYTSQYTETTFDDKSQDIAIQMKHEEIHDNEPTQENDFGRILSNVKETSRIESIEGTLQSTSELNNQDNSQEKSEIMQQNEIRDNNEPTQENDFGRIISNENERRIESIEENHSTNTGFTIEVMPISPIEQSEKSYDNKETEDKENIQNIVEVPYIDRGVKHESSNSENLAGTKDCVNFESESNDNCEDQDESTINPEDTNEDEHIIELKNHIHHPNNSVDQVGVELITQVFSKIESELNENPVKENSKDETITSPIDSVLFADKMVVEETKQTLILDEGIKKVSLLPPEHVEPTLVGSNDSPEEMELITPHDENTTVKENITTIPFPKKTTQKKSINVVQEFDSKQQLAEHNEAPLNTPEKEQQVSIVEIVKSDAMNEKSPIQAQNYEEPLDVLDRGTYEEDTEDSSKASVLEEYLLSKLNEEAGYDDLEKKVFASFEGDFSSYEQAVREEIKLLSESIEKRSKDIQESEPVVSTPEQEPRPHIDLQQLPDSPSINMLSEDLFSKARLSPRRLFSHKKIDTLSIRNAIEEFDNQRLIYERQRDFQTLNTFDIKVRKDILSEVCKIEERFEHEYDQRKKNIKELLEDQKKEISDLWSKRILEYDQLSVKILYDITERHKHEIVQKEEKLRVSFGRKKPNFSKNTIAERSLYNLISSSRQYERGVGMEEKITSLERKDIINFYHQQEQHVSKKLEFVASKQLQELSVTQQRIDRGRKEMEMHMEEDIKKVDNRSNILFKDLERKKAIVSTQLRTFKEKFKTPNSPIKKKQIFLHHSEDFEDPIQESTVNINACLEFFLIIPDKINQFFQSVDKTETEVERETCNVIRRLVDRIEGASQHSPKSSTSGGSRSPLIEKLNTSQSPSKISPVSLFKSAMPSSPSTSSETVTPKKSLTSPLKDSPNTSRSPFSLEEGLRNKKKPTPKHNFSSLMQYSGGKTRIK